MLSVSSPSASGSLPVTDVLAVIPARAGSKGVPGKNLRVVAGRPLLEWTIRTAREVVGAKNTVVSSDGSDILDLAARLGVQTHRRSDENSDDRASSESAILEAIDWFEADNHLPTRLLFLQCTSPCTRASDISELLKVYEQHNADSAFTACPSHAFLWTEKDGMAVPVNHPFDHRPRRQDRQPEFRENGAAYLMNLQAFRKHRHRFFGRCVLSPMPIDRSFEIDDEADFAMVRPSLIARQMPSDVELDAVRAVIFDFDGVLTDNKVSLDQHGVESVSCDRSDGMGFEIAKRRGLPVLILSKERNVVVTARAKKLGVPVIQGVDDKATVLEKWLGENGLRWNQIAYVGNDLNDLDCLRKAGLGVAVADAYPEVLNTANWVLQCPGGHGAAREFFDTLLGPRTK